MSNFNENDLEKIVELFDVALTSDDPRIKDMLKKLLLVTALIETDPSKTTQGPLKMLYNRLYALEQRIGRLEVSNTSIGWGSQIPIAQPFISTMATTTTTSINPVQIDMFKINTTET